MALGNSFQDKIFYDVCPYLPNPILPVVWVTGNVVISDPAFSLELVFTPGNDMASLLVQSRMHGGVSCLMCWPCLLVFWTTTEQGLEPGCNMFWRLCITKDGGMKMAWNFCLQISAPIYDFLRQLTDLCAKILFRANVKFLITVFTRCKL